MKLTKTQLKQIIKEELNEIFGFGKKRQSKPEPKLDLAPATAAGPGWGASHISVLTGPYGEPRDDKILDISIERYKKANPEAQLETKEGILLFIDFVAKGDQADGYPSKWYRKNLEKYWKEKEER